MALICTSCRVENLEDSNFCKHCGLALPMVMNSLDGGRSRSRTASRNSWGNLRRASDVSNSGQSTEPLNGSHGSRRGSVEAMGGSGSRRCSIRGEESYALLLRLETAGPEWRGVEGLNKEASVTPALATACQEEAKKKEEIMPSQQRWGVQRERFLQLNEVSYTPSFPRILCVSRRYLRKNKYVDITGEYHLDLIQGFGGAPIIMPRTMKTVEQMTEYLPMDGLVIAEGNDLSDDVLLKYGCNIPERLEGEAAAKWASDTELDVSKDELEFALMRFALAAGVPIMSFCRGSQMLNCLRGGTLIGDISSQTDSEVPHARGAAESDYDSYRHPIAVKPKTPLAEWYSEDLQDSDELLVNSYHHQASKVLGASLEAMAHSPDGLIEAFYDPSYDPPNGKFVVGLQFHPERMLEDYPGCSRCYESFMEACRAYKAQQDDSA